MLEFLLNNNFISAIVAFALILIPAIIIHELGHFLAAKAVGISVLEFGVGFPPKLFRLFRWGETDFTVNLLPIGGFVRPFGEDMIGPVDDNYNEEEAYPADYAYEAPEKRKVGEAVDRVLSEREILLERGVPPSKIKSVFEASPVERIVFMAAGPFANFILAIVLFFVVAMIGLPQFVGARFQVVNPASTSFLSVNGIGERDAIEMINGAYFADAGQFVAQLRTNAGQPTQLTVLDIETLERSEVTVVPEFDEFAGYIRVLGIADGSPAQQAGLRVGDLISAVNGRDVALNNPIENLQEATRTNEGGAITLGIVRGGRNITDVSLVPQENPPAGQGKIGISVEAIYFFDDGTTIVASNPQQELIPQGVGESIQYGFSRTWETIEMIFSIPAQIFSGSVSPEEARPISIVGISQIGGQFVQQSIREGTPGILLNFMALISIFLGFTNLLPFPPLDGGRILFVFIEIVRGRPVPMHIEQLVYKIGIGLLLALGLVVILYDVFNPFQLPG